MKLSLALALAFLSAGINAAPAAKHQNKQDKKEMTTADNAAKAPANDPWGGLNIVTAKTMETEFKSKMAVPVDANGEDTRTKMGVVPGAIKLMVKGESHDFDMSVLPTDKNQKLVFYCGGNMCTSAPDAAKAALKAGYTNVHVMREGISGWVGAGLGVDKL